MCHCTKIILGDITASFWILYLKRRLLYYEKNYKEKTASYEKNSKIVVSKLQRIHARLNRQSFAMLISYLIIIAMGVIIYFKIFKGI